MSAEQFVEAVMRDDLTAIVKIPGVGKKTAERLLIEMRDKLTDWQTSTTDTTLPAIDLAIAPSDERNDRMVQADAITALVSLGYTQQQATKAVKSVFQPDYTSEQLIRDALKSML
jgi:Holliday junction DNA helicase RuvA